jgi:hypothetical protein
MSNKSIQEFDKLMSVLNDAENGVKRETSVSESGVKSMDEILKRFNSAVEEVEKYSSKGDKTLNQIKDTKMISENAITIGPYKIEKVEGTYSLYDEYGSVLVDDVLLYETVYSIASHLYKGKTFSSSKIVGLLNNNSRYEKHLTEARMNKKNYNKYKQEHDFDGMDIENTKFEENKFRAKSFKQNILKEYKNLGK